jgi:hypothetical protein
MFANGWQRNWLEQGVEPREQPQKSVIPAKAGIQKPLIFMISPLWTPASAGVTASFSTLC